MANFLQDRYNEILGGAGKLIGGIGNAVQQPFRQTLNPIAQQSYTRGQYISPTQKYNSPSVINNTISTLRNTPGISQLESLGRNPGEALPFLKPIEDMTKVFARRSLDAPNVNPQLKQRSQRVLGNNQSALEDAKTIAGGGLSIAGMLNPANSLMFAGVGTGISSLSDAVQGRNPLDNLGNNFQQNLKSGTQMAGLNSLLPFSNIKAVQTMSMIPKLSAEGLINVAQGGALDYLNNTPITAEGVLTNAITPFAFKGVSKAFGSTLNLTRYLRGEPEVKTPSILNVPDEFTTKEKTLIGAYKEQKQAYKTYEAKGDRSMMNAVKKNLDDIASQIGEIRKNRFDRVMQSGKVNVGEGIDAVKGKQEPTKISSDRESKQSPEATQTSLLETTQSLPESDVPLNISKNQESLGFVLKNNSKRLLKKSEQVSDMSNNQVPLTDNNIQIKNPQEPFYNVNRVGVDNTTKQGIADTVMSPDVTTKINETVGTPLTFEEVKNKAGVSDTLNKTFTKADAEKMGAEALNLRNKVAELSSLGVNDEQFQEALIKDKAYGQFIARLLGQRRIISDPSQKTIFNQMISKIIKNGADPEEVAKAAKGVNFEDPKQATEFYRKFIKTNIGDWNNLLRYNSMLSSPNTHINNAFSNLVNTTVVAPIEKTITGTLDLFSSKITGKPRQYRAGEGLAYSKGYVENVKKAATNFTNALRGKTDSTELDLRNIPLATKGAGQKAYTILSYPMRMLEASDQFFRTLTEGGEKAALNYRQAGGIKVKNIGETANSMANYRLYREGLKDPRQGKLLDAIDTFTGLIEQARNSKNSWVSVPAKWTLPFVRTPMNIFKQGIEYSPAGALTMIGAQNKTEQLSKAIVGASVMLGASSLLGSGRLTWAEPTDVKKKQAFRDAGLQPYAVKIGDNWVSFTKLPPAISFNLAFVAALNDAQEKGLMSDGALENTLSALSKYGNFLADQSYAKNIGDLLSAVKGDPESMTSFISNYPQQEIPFRALGGWMARLTDNYQRKVDSNAGFLDKQVQQLMMNLPFASQYVPARENQYGEPILNQNKEINAFSPLKVTTENADKKAYYDILEENAKQNREQNYLKNQMEQGNDITGLNKVSAAEQTYTTAPQISALPQGIKEVKGTFYARIGNSVREYDNQLDAEQALNKYNFKQTNEKSLIKDGVLYKKTNGGDVSVKELPTFDTPKNQVEAIKQNEERLKEGVSIFRDTNVRDEDKQAVYKMLGVKESDLNYYDIATSSEAVRNQYLSELLQGSKDYSTLLNTLKNLRYEVNGQKFLNDTMITDLYKQGVISYQDSQGLKNTVYDTKTGKLGTKKVRVSTKKPKKIKLKLPKSSKITVKQIKPSKSVRDIRKKYVKLRATLKAK